MKAETKFTYMDYKTIREAGRRIDCTVTEADFNTMSPNPRRIKYVADDINRYLSQVNGGKV